MSALSHVIILISVLIRISIGLTYYSWNISSTVLPTVNYDQAVGYYNNTIFLLGGNDGYDNRWTIIEYDINNDQFTTLTDSLPTYILGTNTKYFTQIENILYIQKYYDIEAAFYTFDLKTKIFTTLNITFPSSLQNSGNCITSQSGFIFVVGGLDYPIYSDELNIYNTYNNSWLSPSLPTLKTARYGLACAINNHKLYAIGGSWDYGILTRDETPTLNTIERLYMGENLADIYSQQWQYIDNLPQERTSARALVYGNDILVIGGTNASWIDNDTCCVSTAFKQIIVIDTVTDSVSVGGNLKHEVFRAASIIVNGKGYVFGGRIVNPTSAPHPSASIDTIQYSLLLSPVFQLIYVKI